MIKSKSSLSPSAPFLSRKERLGVRVPERRAWSACTGKGGLERMCRKGRLGAHVPEGEA